MVEILLKSLATLGTKIFIAVASGPLIEWAFFYLAEAIVKTTKTPHDDAFLAEIKANYDKHANYTEADKRAG